MNAEPVFTPVVITLTPEQRALLRAACGRSVSTLGVEPTETGSGWLYSAKGNKFWLLKHPDPEAYAAARRRKKPHVDARKTKFRLRVGRSHIHRWGVFAAERIPARRNVIEYSGEHVNPAEAYRRVKGAEETYIFKLDDFWNIDGAIGGVGAEFINHSCDPNLRWRKLKDRVMCQSVRPIAMGDELTVDYHFSAKAPKVRCNCGSPKCRGTINFIPGRRKRHHGRK